MINGVGTFARSASVLAAALLVSCAGLPPGAAFPRRESVALEDLQGTTLGAHFSKLSDDHPDRSGFRVLSVGVDGFVARIRMVEMAERALDLQYYIFRGDETGVLLMTALVGAADRGVRVRILVDDGDKVDGDERLARLDGYKGIEVRIFNPFRYRGSSRFFRALEFIGNSRRLDYRMHNKLIVADNAVALIGGRNVGDQYFQTQPETQFADDDVFVAGPAVRALSTTFDRFWNDGLSIPAAALRVASAPTAAAELLAPAPRRHRHAPAAVASGIDYGERVAAGAPIAGIMDGTLTLVWAPASVYADPPDKRRALGTRTGGRVVADAVAVAAGRTQADLLIVTPYLVPAAEELETLHSLRRRNATVRVLTNSLASTRDVIAFAGYARIRGSLAMDGIGLFETRANLADARGSGQTMHMSRYGNYGLHAKLWVFDDELVFIGSMNFDQRSKRTNTEVGLIIDSPELASQVTARFERMIVPGNAYAVTMRDMGHGVHRLSWETSEAGTPANYSVDPATSVWRRWAVRLLSVVPLDREL